MSDYVFIGNSNYIAPIPGEKKFNEKKMKVEFIPGPRFKRGLVYDLTKDQEKIIKNIQDFVSLDDLAEIAQDLDLDPDAYDVWEDLAQAVIWLKWTLPHLKGAIRRGASHNLKELQPVELHFIKGETQKKEKAPEPVADVPEVPEVDQDAIEPEALADIPDEPDQAPEPPKPYYYCTQCGHKHKRASKIGLNHEKHEGPEP